MWVQMIDNLRGCVAHTVQKFSIFNRFFGI
jgi:hypothetical protein